jgi:RHS repeat-associated protein
VNEEGQVTKYEYDTQSRVKTVLYPWSEEKAETDRREAEEAGLYFTPDRGNGERYTLTGSEVTALRNVLSLAGPGRGNAVSGSQLVWRESYTYDGNGNRAGKSTPWGTIAYTYDAENRLVSRGTIRYVYDADGNLVREQGPRKEASYQYNGRNRMEYAEVTDAAGGEGVRSEYRYDGLGRRTLAREEGGETLRVLYDGGSFEAVREGPSYRDGQLTGRSAAAQSGGAANTGTGQPNTATGERYRWLSEGEAGRTRSGEPAAQSRAGRYEGIKVTLYGKGEAVAVSRSTGSGNGPVYLGKDIVGSVRSTTNGTGGLEERYEYDAFGTPYRGSFENGMNLGYTGKPYDAVTGLYDYGYRDYQPATARFTTVDPVRDGSNWFAYVNNDPVNWVDLWGLSASDRSNSPTNSSEVQYTAQTVQYNSSVYYYEIQTISSPMVPADTKMEYETRYSYDSNAITANKNNLINTLKNTGFTQSRQNQSAFYYVNTKTREVAHITIGETQQASSLPSSLRPPAQGEVLRTSGTAAQNGFPR